MSLITAARTARIEPFHVMELVKRARALEAQGRSIIHMSIGEPDFTAPPAVLDALRAALPNSQSQGYSAALGIAPLRQAIASFYQSRYGLTLNPARVVVTAGASGALLLAMAALLNSGDEVLMPDPSYPCNRHFVSAFEGRAVMIPSGPEHRFQLTKDMVEAHWGPHTRGVLIASPSNPTGTSINFSELTAIVNAVAAHGGFTIVDEIYHALSYGEHPRSALEISDDLIIVNSFSKYFNMTGWRLGWLVVPESLVPTLEKLAQNLFICASAPAQYAALACFEPETLALYEQRKEEFRQRRDYLVPQLQQLGFDIPVLPDGAFYIYADCSRFFGSAYSARGWHDSETFANAILDQAGVSVVPGIDFGHNEPQRWIRLSYATSQENLHEAVRRLAAMLA